MKIQYGFKASANCVSVSVPWLLDTSIKPICEVSTFPFNAVCVASEIGLLASLVLSTFPNPTCDLVTSCGLDVFVKCDNNDDNVVASIPELTASN